MYSARNDWSNRRCQFDIVLSKTISIGRRNDVNLITISHRDRVKSCCICKAQVQAEEGSHEDKKFCCDGIPSKSMRVVESCSLWKSVDVILTLVGHPVRAEEFQELHTQFSNTVSEKHYCCPYVKKHVCTKKNS